MALMGTNITRAVHVPFIYTSPDSLVVKTLAWGREVEGRIPVSATLGFILIWPVGELPAS